MEQVVHNIDTCLQRTWDGVRLTVKIPLILEKFFQSSSDGVTEPVGDLGRNWRTLPGGSPLMVYRLARELGGAHPITKSPNSTLSQSFRLDVVGSKFTLDIANIAFLRLVGASNDEGVSFVVPGVYAEDTLADLSRGFDAGIASFCRDFVKPIKISSVISLVERVGGSEGHVTENRQIS